MKAIHKRSIGIAAAAAVIILIAYKLVLNRNIVEAKMYRYDPSQNILVSADSVRYGVLARSAAYAGTFEPTREVKIMAETQGKVVDILINEGDAVRPGQKMAQVDTTLLALQRAAVEVQIEILKKDVTRYTALAQAEAIQAVQLEKAEFAMKTAEIQKRTLDEQIGKCRIIAPFGGVVTMKMFELGSFLNPGVPLFQLSDISSLKLCITISEENISDVAKNQTVTLEADVYPGRTISGIITMVGSKADVSHNYPVQILVSNSCEYPVKAGMYGKVLINDRSNTRRLLIPAAALVGSQKDAAVYVIQNNKARLKKIVLGGGSDQWYEAASGLTERDMVITGGQINLYDGAPVAAGHK